jgi:Holliday junction resolvase
MPNRNYIKGVRKERKIVNDARASGLIAFRSAGSHSCIDVVIIDIKNKEIKLIQSKPDTMPKTTKIKIENKHTNLNNKFNVEFKVI